MTQNEYPKILIIGESIHRLTGTGITLSNLLEGWPKDKIAVLSGKNIWWSDVNMCENFFIWKTRISLLYENYIRLFSKNKSINVRGQIYADEIIKRQNQNIQNKTDKIAEYSKASDGKLVKYKLHSILNYLGKTLTFFTNIIGLDLFFQKIVITNSLVKWFNTYQPEVIITFLNNSPQYQLVIDFYKKHSIPIVVYPGDDYIKQIPSKSLLYCFWKYKINKEFDYLLKIASVRLSICDYMSQKYKERYNLEFSAYHNPVDCEKWLPYSRNKWEINGTFKILYIGRLGYDNIPMLHLLAKVVDELNDAGHNVRLDLRFNILTDGTAMNKFNIYRNTHLRGAISLSEYIEQYYIVCKLLPKYDLLYLPLGFDKKSFNLYSLSMSTKISEYMISGSPILIHAPKNTAIFDYAKKEKFGYLLDKNTKSGLKNAVLELIENEHLRERLGEQAKNIAIQNHDAKTVRNNFRIEIINAARQKYK